MRGAAGHELDCTQVGLTITEPEYKALLAAGRESGPKESAWFLDLGYWRHRGGVELFVRGVIPIPADELTQSRAHVHVSGCCSVEMFERFRASRTGALGFCHSHPGGPLSLSGPDARLLREVAADLRRLRAQGAFASLVCWPEARLLGGRAVWWTGAGQMQTGDIQRVRVVGLSRLQINSGEEPRTDRRLLQRQWSLFGSGQTRISQVRLGVVGVSSNSHLAIAAAQAGFSRLVLVDPDRLEVHNLNRFRGAGLADLGRPKIDVVRREILKLHPDARVRCLRTEFAEVVAELATVDVLIGGVDNTETRLALNRFCAATLKPYLDVSGGGEVADGRLTGYGFQVSFYRPGSTPCFLCANPEVTKDFVSSTRRELMETTRYLQGVETSPPQVVTLSLQGSGKALEALLFYVANAGVDLPVRLVYDALAHRFSHFSVSQAKECGICGTQGLEGLGQVALEPGLEGALDVVRTDTSSGDKGGEFSA